MSDLTLGTWEHAARHVIRIYRRPDGPTINLSPPASPRFAQSPWRTHKPFYLGRGWKTRNPNAAKQAAAKRARKITRRKSR